MCWGFHTTQFPGMGGVSHGCHTSYFGSELCEICSYHWVQVSHEMLLLFSSKMLICALNNGSNALDFIYRRFCKMYNCMANSENTKLSMS